MRYERRGLVVDSARRPGDVTAREPGGGGLIVVDVTCSYTGTPTGLPRACGRPGGAALEAEAAKLRAAPELADPTATFVPFAVDDYGFVAPHGQAFLRTLAARAVARGVEHFTEGQAKAAAARLLHRWRSRLSAALHGAVAQVICVRADRALRAADPEDGWV